MCICDAPIVEGGSYYTKLPSPSKMGASHMHMLLTIGNPIVIRCSDCRTIQNLTTTAKFRSSFKAKNTFQKHVCKPCNIMGFDHGR